MLPSTKVRRLADTAMVAMAILNFPYPMRYGEAG